MKNILLLHGALGSAKDLNPLSESLKNFGLNTHNFSFSGHGHMAFNVNFGIETFTEELYDYILKNKLQNASVFGYSMGGYVALRLAHKQKNLLGNIITLGTKFNWNEESVQKETRLLNPEKMVEKIPAFAKSLEIKHGTQWKDLVVKTADLMREIGRKDFLSTDVLKTLEAPILLGLADKDQMVTLDETRHVFSQLPNAAMYMLPNSKHPIESINTHLLSQLIKNFTEAS